MTLSAMRVLPAENKSDTMHLRCISCGEVLQTMYLRDMWMYPLATLVVWAENHACKVQSIPAPRAEQVIDTRLRDFLSDNLVPDPSGRIPMDELRERWTQEGEAIENGEFGRRIRRVLPPDAEIRREMIRGIKARRLIGMRWK